MKKGDAIARVAQPIAKTIDYFFGTDIQGCSGCKRMQNNLNAGMNFADAFYDRFWRKTNEEQTMEEIEYLVNQTKSISVVADSLENAMKKVINGEGTIVSSNISANPRPKPRQVPQPPTA